MTSHPLWRLQLSTVAVLAFATIAGAQQPAPAGAPPLQVLGINSGPSGAEKNGVFTLSEERSIFSRSEDRQAIVVFQWAGVPGLHKLAALWRSPDGTQSAASTLDYMAREARFGAHWSLALPPSMALGTWSIEATVDGQPAGRYSFEVRDDKVVAAPVKRLLTNAELYERLNRVFVLVERASTAGRPLDPAGGVLIAPGRIASAMFALDGADVLRAATGTAAAQVVSSVVAFSRAQDWAILELAAANAGALPRADAQSVSVGTKCFSMEGGPAGARVLLEGQVTGEARVAGYPQPLVNFFNGTGTPGAPVITEFGELIGLVGGPGVTGATRIHELLRFRAELKGTLIVPIHAIRVPSVGAPLAIAQLRKDGQLVPPVVGDLHILSGGFARNVQRNRAQPSDQRHEFSAADKNFVLFINWNPQERLQGMVFVRVYDKDNRLVDQSEPKKQDLRQGRLIMTSWPTRVPPNPGRYRIDVLIDDRTMWRDFVTITP